MSSEIARQLANHHSVLTCIDRREEIFYRIEIDGQVYYSQDYKRVKRRNSFTVSYNKDGPGEELLNFGLVQYYIFFSSTKTVMAVLKELKKTRITCRDEFQLSSGAIDTVSSLGKIYPVECNESQLTLVNVEKLLHKCLYIEINTSKYVVNIVPSLLCLHD